MRRGPLLLRVSLRTFPPEFRRRYGAEMMATFEARSHQVRNARGPWGARLHLARTALDVVAEGLAERLARAPLPGAPPVVDPSHPGVPFMATLWSDLRLALRLLRRRPGFALVALSTLGVGLGASSAMFTLVNQVVLRPLPFPEPDQLVRFYDTRPERGISTYTSAPGNFVDWRAQLGQAFVGVAAWNTTRLTYSGTSPAESIEAVLASAEWFATLGVAPVLGRTFLRSEEQPGEDRVVMVSHRFWSRFLNGEAAAVGSTIPLDGVPYTVVGVMPASFAFPTPAIDLWVPLAMSAETAQARGVHYLEVIGRLGPGVTIEAGQAQLDLLMARLTEAYPEPLMGWGARLVGLQEAIVGSARPRLLIFLGAVALLLLIGVVNVANLMIVRAMERSRELAIRAALGASRGRVIRQLVMESVTIALAAGAVGVILAGLVLQAVVRFAAGTIPQVSGLHLEWITVVAAFGLALLVGLLLGLIASMRVLGRNTGASLRGGAVVSPSGPGRDRLRSAFVVLQIATAMVLVVGAGLLVQSFRNLIGVDTGYGARAGLVATIAAPSSRYPDPASRQRFFLELHQRLAQLPGVDAAAMTTQLPLEGYGINFAFWMGGTNPPMDQRWSGDFRVVTAGYFATMEIPLLRGRDFTSQDQPGSAPAIVVSESLVAQHFPGVDPIGRELHLGYGDNTRRWTIVGVVGDVRQRALAGDPVPGFYLPLTQVGWSSMRAVLRTRGEPMALLEPVRRELASLDPLIAIRQAETLADRFSQAAGTPRFNAILVSGFALVALGLALAGIFSIMSFMVSQHTREIGVRMALGERPGQVRWATSRRGLQLAVAGIVLGLGASLTLTRGLEGMLYGVERVDPPTLAAGAALFVLVAVAGSYWPARRASAVDPVVALRGE